MALTLEASSASLQRMPRKRKFVEVTVARFPEGTFARIEAVIGKAEERADFICEAVERENERRERLVAKTKREGGA